MNTIEEKARAYDRVSKKVKDLFEGRQKMYSDVNRTLEYLFPELVESEDEKIRKGIFKALSKKDARDVLISQGVEVSDALAWLEKQGLKSNPYSGVSFNYNGNTWGMCARDNGVDILFNRKLIQHISDENQGEQEKDIMEDAILDGSEDGLIAETITYKNEKQGGQKSTNKVEPKFNVGDYIKHNKANIICKIISVNGGFYYVESIETNSRIELFNAEQNFHLWTIQDAKNGDVLVTDFEEDNMIVMYHSMCTIDTINVHCCLDNKFTRANLGVFDVEDVKPATKEQHDILFEEMHKAGYVWDVEKKELKKINSYCQENCKGFQETGKCFADGDCKAKREAEQKPAWSEEDEDFFNDTIAFLKNAKNAIDHVDWLKSLKQRIGG